MFRGRWREEAKTIEESQHEKAVDKDAQMMKVPIRFSWNKIQQTLHSILGLIFPLFYRSSQSSEDS